MTVLRVTDLHAAYGPIKALHGVGLEVAEGEIVTLIGANGAGKSTLLMTICGSPRAAQGRVEFLGEDITSLATHHIVRRGIAWIPEERRVLPNLTVRENLRLVCPNCDSQLPTYKSRNRGSGRHSRRQRYRDGQSY